jgi:hypothetical protein
MNDRREAKIEASIGLSRKWDAREAGREVAKSAIKQLNQPPSFFLLFSTIHYKDHGGFQEFLNGVWNVLPEETPLIGGTFAGFINNYGCYARGATALAVSYPNIDIAIGWGKHTKRTPKKAARQCAEMIKKQLEESRYEHKFLINSISGPTIPKLPFIGRVNFVKSKIMGSFLSYVGMPLTEHLGYGIGKEGDIVDEIGRQMKDYHIIGGSTMDDGKQLACFQFCRKRVYKNAVVAMGGTIDSPIFLKGTIGLRDTEKRFRITKTTFGNRIITKIENMPAKKRFLEITNLPDELYKNLSPFYYKTSNYFPITFEGKREFVSGVGAFLGENILLGYKARGNDAIILSVTGQESIKAIDTVFVGSEKGGFPFVFVSASGIRFMNMIGDRAHLVKENLDRILGNIPYVLIGPVNENIGYPNKPAFSRVYSFNALSFKKLKHL